MSDFEVSSPEGQDPRVHEDICGVIEFRGSTEFICIAKPHAKVYQRRVSDRTHRRGDPIFSTSIKADQHYFVNRWPNRSKE